MSIRDLSQMFKNIQGFQEKFKIIKESLSKIEIEGSSGGGLIKVIYKGNGELKNISIDKSIISQEEVEILEDLIVAAINDGKRKVETFSSSEMDKVIGDIPVPSWIKSFI